MRFFLCTVYFTAPGTVSNTYAQVARAQSCANHVQHIGRSRATCRVVRRDSSAVEFDRVEISYILTLCYWLKRLGDEGGEETGEPGNFPGDELQS